MSEVSSHTVNHVVTYKKLDVVPALTAQRDQFALCMSRVHDGKLKKKGHVYMMERLNNPLKKQGKAK